MSAIAYFEMKLGKLGICICCGSILSLVQFLFSFIFCVVMYDDECKTKKNKNWTKDRIEPQHIHKRFVYHIIVLHQEILSWVWPINIQVIISLLRDMSYLKTRSSISFILLLIPLYMMYFCRHKSVWETKTSMDMFTAFPDYLILYGIKIRCR